MRLNKKIFSAAVMIVVLSLALNLVSFAAPIENESLSATETVPSLKAPMLGASREPYSSSVPSKYRTHMDYSVISFSGTRPDKENAVPLGRTDTFLGYPTVLSGQTSDNYNKGLSLQIQFPNATSFSLSAGYTFAIDLEIDCSSCQSISLDVAKYGVLDSVHTTRYDMKFDGDISSEWLDGHMYTYLRGTYYVTMPEWGAYPFVLIYLNTDWFVWSTVRINDIYYVSPEQEITGGWNSGDMNNSNQQLGGALGELDDMQQNADNDLHDALGDLESPTVDFNGNAVSFITSSVSMLWGSLGGFSAVLLCALFITVFNFISRYRGS